MFTIHCKVRKEGSEKYINYDSIFVKLRVFIYICMQRRYCGAKHTQMLTVVKHLWATTTWQAFHSPTMHFPTSSSSQCRDYLEKTTFFKMKELTHFPPQIQVSNNVPLVKGRIASALHKSQCSL